ncbi:PaaI family thioesterase [bacterium]|nr:PaaI family thioesterase [bacterium]
MGDANVLRCLSEELSREPFGKVFGFRLKKIDAGHAIVEMEVTEKLQNSIGIIHGGAIFSLMDQAFQAASNSHGTIAVALNLNVTYFKSPQLGDILEAEAREVNLTRRTGAYAIEVKDSGGSLIANCQALVYRKDNPLPFLGE